MADTPPPCRTCGKHDTVCIYRDEAPEQTICHECCPNAEHADGETGHQFSYARGEGWTCNYCGIDRNPNNYDYAEDPSP